MGMIDDVVAAVEEEETMMAMSKTGITSNAYEWVRRMANGNAVVVFSMTRCCMSHVVKHLLLGLGVGPTVYELDQIDQYGSCQIQSALSNLLAGCSSSATGGADGASPPVPVVFIGGMLLGGVEKVMASHINGSLVPLLKQAGALWL